MRAMVVAFVLPAKHCIDVYTSTEVASPANPEGVTFDSTWVQTHGQIREKDWKTRRGDTASVRSPSRINRPAAACRSSIQMDNFNVTPSGLDDDGLPVSVG